MLQSTEKIRAKQPPLFLQKTNEKDRKALTQRNTKKESNQRKTGKMLLQFTSNRLRQSNSNVSSSDAKNATAQTTGPRPRLAQKKRGEKQKRTGGFVGIGVQRPKRAVFMPGNEKIVQPQHKNVRSTPPQPAGQGGDDWPKHLGCR